MNAKQAAAIKAAEFIRDGMRLGLGTGTTALYAIQEAGTLHRAGMKLQVAASSLRSEQLAIKEGLNLIPFSTLRELDLYIDGADEVDAKHNLIKGGGGALLREKILAYHSREFIVIVDESKLVDTLGKFSLATEVVPFAIELTLQKIIELGCEAAIRMTNKGRFISDNNNHIIDCHFGSIPDPDSLHQQLKSIPGLVETGLFPARMVSKVVVGHPDGSATIAG